MKPLTAELLQKFDYMPDNAYLDSTDLQQLLGTKSLGLHIRHGYLPLPSERHKACTPHYKAMVKDGYKVHTYSSNNKKVYWRIGVLRQFVKLNADTHYEVLQSILQA